MEKSHNKKMIVWTTGLDEFILGSENFNGGIAVQLTFWATVFRDNGWAVYSFSDKANSNLQGIEFKLYKSRKGLNAILFDFLSPLIFFSKIRPRVVLFRGAGRNLFFVGFWAKIFRAQIVLMGAHDTDFQPGKEIIKRGHDRLLYRTGLRLVKKVIVQNETQKECLYNFYRKDEAILIPNIWPGYGVVDDKSIDSSGFVLWVANFHRRKRPKVFIKLAKELPDYNFVMIGAPKDLVLYQECKLLADNIANLQFLGPLPFDEANTYFRGAKVFVCTSESEGFPNTFLQSWSARKPVVTTFDPGGVVHRNNVGVVVDNLDELAEPLSNLLGDAGLYNVIRRSIDTYFKKNHDANRAYNLLIEYCCR